MFANDQGYQLTTAEMNEAFLEILGNIFEGNPRRKPSTGEAQYIQVHLSWVGIKCSRNESIKIGSICGEQVEEEGGSWSKQDGTEY